MRRPITITSADGRLRALRVLEQGGVVVLPTDTLPGFSAAASFQAAAARIRDIKGAPDDKRFVLLAASVDMVESYVRDFGCTTRDVLAAAWPAPLTAVFRAGAKCPAWLGNTVAVRVPDSPELRSIVASLGEAIVSTSVNRSGERPETQFDSIEREFGVEVDLIVATPRKLAGRASASTVVDFTGDVPVVLRRGAYDWPAAAAGDSNPSK